LNLPINRDEILIYPNPAKDNVQFALTSDKKQEMKMRVYDLTGRLVDATELSLKTGTNVFSINTGQWRPGTYIVQLMTQTQTINKKLIIQADMIWR
jgi:hypothetical protein